MVDRVFGFLPALIGGQEGEAPLGFEVSGSYKGIIDHFNPFVKWLSTVGELENMCWCLIVVADIVTIWRASA